VDQQVVQVQEQQALRGQRDPQELLG
jgi:hypothetical protein